MARLGPIDAVDAQLFVWQALRLVTSTFTLRGGRGTWRIDVHFAWQAWHLAPSTCILRGRHGTCGSGLALVARLGPVNSRGRGGFWQAWHLVTSTFTLRGRHGTWRIDVHFAWQGWHLRLWTGSGGALGSRKQPWTPRLLAGVALGDIDLHFALAWCRTHLVTSTFTLRGSLGTYRTILCGKRGAR